jgi:hypothetical protein
MWRRVLVVWSASRLAVLSLGLLLTTQLGWHRALEPWQTKFFRSITGWDSVYYLKISHTGYHPGKDLAFFPLYPATIWTTREVLQVGDAVAAVAISNLALLVGLLGMYVLARDRLSEDHARRGVLYLVLSPYAFVLAMAYSEGLFLALATWLFVLSDRRRGCRRHAARVRRRPDPRHGLALVAPLACGPGGAGRSGRSPSRSPLVAFAAMPPGSTCRRRPLAMVHAQRRWGGHPSIPPVSLADQFLDFARTHDVFFLIVGVTFIAYLALLADPAARPVAPNRWEDTLYVCGIFAMPLLSGVLQSSGRFGLVAFPLAFAMADLGLRSERVHRAYVVYAPTAQIILFAAAALGYRPP